MLRVKGWINEYGEDGVYISFSGGKDSTVLMDIIRNLMGEKNIPAVFVDVPTQFPELREFAKTWDDVEIIRPKLSFMDICEKYGFPLISKEVSNTIYYGKRSVNSTRYKKIIGEFTNKNGEKSFFNYSKYKYFLDAPFNISDVCCDILKKHPCREYEKKNKRVPILAQLADESRKRTTAWTKTGCNAFNLERPQSNPMAFWTEQDILEYIYKYKIPICSVYGNVACNDKFETTGCKRTGCMLCGFGCHMKGDDRFIQLKETHPKMYNLLDIVKNNGVTFREAIEWTNEHGKLNIKL